MVKGWNCEMVLRWEGEMVRGSVSGMWEGWDCGIVRRVGLWEGGIVRWLEGWVVRWWEGWDGERGEWWNDEKGKTVRERQWEGWDG